MGAYLFGFFSGMVLTIVCVVVGDALDNRWAAKRQHEREEDARRAADFVAKGGG
jgi:capsular polysaccharide biosynthesis protein